MMRHFGVDVTINADDREILVPNDQSYRSRVVDIAGEHVGFLSNGRCFRESGEDHSIESGV